MNTTIICYYNIIKYEHSLELYYNIIIISRKIVTSNTSEICVELMLVRIRTYNIGIVLNSDKLTV